MSTLETEHDNLHEQLSDLQFQTSDMNDSVLESAYEQFDV